MKPSASIALVIAGIWLTTQVLLGGLVQTMIGG